jgi:hypothetical protein
MVLLAGTWTSPSSRRHDNVAQILAGFRELVLDDNRLACRVRRDHVCFLKVF